MLGSPVSWRSTRHSIRRYDEDGYCVKMTTCAIPEDIAEKLAELNK